MEYELVTTKKIKVDNALLMSMKDFETELKLNDKEVYVMRDEKIMYILDVEFLDDGIIEGDIHILGGIFHEHVKYFIFSFDLKRFYKIEQ